MQEVKKELDIELLSKARAYKKPCKYCGYGFLCKCDFISDYGYI